MLTQMSNNLKNNMISCLWKSSRYYKVLKLKFKIMNNLKKRMTCK